jgi:hypothetical protein
MYEKKRSHIFKGHGAEAVTLLQTVVVTLFFMFWIRFILLPLQVLLPLPVQNLFFESIFFPISVIRKLCFRITDIGKNVLSIYESTWPLGEMRLSGTCFRRYILSNGDKKTKQGENKN